MYDDFDSYGQVDIAGATTDSCHYRILRAAVGHEYDPLTGDGVRISSGLAGFSAQIDEDFSRIQGMYVEATGSNSNTAAIRIGAANCWVINCVATVPDNNLADQGACFAVITALGGTNSFFVNCIAYGNGATSAGPYRGFFFDGSALFVGCVSFKVAKTGSTTYGFAGGALATAYNCASFDSGTGDYNNVTNEFDLASSDTTGSEPALRSLVANNEFVAPDQQDFRLPTGGTLVDAGTDLSSFGLPYTEDFEEVPRGAVYEIGAYEGSVDVAAGQSIGGSVETSGRALAGVVADRTGRSLAEWSSRSFAGVVSDRVGRSAAETLGSAVGEILQNADGARLAASWAGRSSAGLVINGAARSAASWSGRASATLLVQRTGGIWVETAGRSFGGVVADRSARGAAEWAARSQGELLVQREGRSAAETAARASGGLRVNASGRSSASWAGRASGGIFIPSEAGRSATEWSSRTFAGVVADRDARSATEWGSRAFAGVVANRVARSAAAWAGRAAGAALGESSTANASEWSGRAAAGLLIERVARSAFSWSGSARPFLLLDGVARSGASWLGRAAAQVMGNGTGRLAASWAGRALGGVVLDRSARSGSETSGRAQGTVPLPGSARSASSWLGRSSGNAVAPSALRSENVWGFMPGATRGITTCELTPVLAQPQDPAFRTIAPDVLDTFRRTTTIVRGFGGTHTTTGGSVDVSGNATFTLKTSPILALEEEYRSDDFVEVGRGSMWLDPIRCEAAGYLPAVGDQVTLGSVYWNVIGIETYHGGNQIAAYRLILSDGEIQSSTTIVTDLDQEFFDLVEELVQSSFPAEWIFRVWVERRHNTGTGEQVNYESRDVCVTATPPVPRSEEFRSQDYTTTSRMETFVDVKQLEQQVDLPFIPHRGQTAIYRGGGLDGQEFTVGAVEAYSPGSKDVLYRVEIEG